MSSSQPNSIDPSRFVDAFTTRELRHGLRESTVDIDENGHRDKLRSLVADHDDADQLVQDIRENAKVKILEDRHVKHNHIPVGGQSVTALATNLSVREAYYYNSYFKHASRTAYPYRLQSLDGALAEIADEASTTEEARSIFTRRVDEEVLDPAYEQATGREPAPLVGHDDDQFRPRLVEFETPDVIYVEYWRPGSSTSQFDIRTGDYEQIQTLYRAVLRVDLDIGLVEAISDESTDTNEDLVERFLAEFADSAGVDRIDIDSEDIHQASSNLGIVSTLNEFVDEETKVRLTTNQAGSVEVDQMNERMEDERDYSRSNFQIILGQDDDIWEVVYPRDIDGIDPSADEESTDVTFDAVSGHLDREYDDVKPVTLTLGSDKSVFRIQKKALAPGTRRDIVHILGEELDWI